MPGAGEGSTFSSPKERAISQAERLRAVSDGIRQRADLVAKAVGGLGLTVLTGVGIAKLGDIFPFPGGGDSWFWLLMELVGLAVMAGVLAFFFTLRLWMLNEPVVVRADEDQCEIIDEEKSRIGLVYDEIAALNGVPSLLAYEARGHRLQRVADRVPDSVADNVRGRASEIAVEVGATLERARLLIIRQRTANTVRDGRALLAYAAFVLGLVLFASGADFLDGKRSVELAKSCAEVSAAGVGQELPSICGKVIGATDVQHVSAGVLRGIVDALLEFGLGVAPEAVQQLKSVLLAGGADVVSAFLGGIVGEVGAALGRGFNDKLGFDDGEEMGVVVDCKPLRRAIVRWLGQSLAQREDIFVNARVGSKAIERGLQGLPIRAFDPCRVSG